MQNLRPILLVEDDQVDVMRVERAVKGLKIANPLVHSTNGEEAMEYLRNEANERPCVILLDLNMPKMSGPEFLDVVKGDEALKELAVIVFTPPEIENGADEIFNLGAAGYVGKFVSHKEFVEALKIIIPYCSLSELPVEK